MSSEQRVVSRVDRAAIQRSLVKRFRKELWQPFVAACKRYALVPESAKVVVPLDGTTPSLLAAFLLEELHRHSDVPFDLVVLETSSTDAAAFLPGESKPAETPVSPERGDVAAATERSSTALPLTEELRGDVAAATERFRYAVPDCMSDVTETVLTSMLRDEETRGVLPIEAPDESGIVRIRPLYCIEEKDIRAFCRYNHLTYVPREADPKRQMARNLLETVKKEDPDAEIRVFRALHSVHADTFPKPTD